jgi:hypothetical protein
MMNDMLASMEVLSSFGEKSKQIFKELAKQAKQTGIEVATLVGLEERFMTFDASAELAGKINAMAGRVVLDPMQLMLATGDEKQALIQQAAQSMAIDPNNARAVKYAANAFGISPGEFQKLIGPKDDPERQATSLQEVIKMSISMGQKLRVILENFAVAAYPILFVLQKLVTWLAEGAVYLDSWLGKTAMVVLISGLMISKFSVLIGLFKGIAMGVVGAGKALLGFAANAGTAAGQMDSHVQAYKNAQNMAKGGPAAGAGLMAFAQGLLVLSLATLAFAGAAFLVASAFTVFALGIMVLVKASNEASMGQMAELGIGLAILGAAFIGFAFEMAIASAFLAFGFPAFIALGGLLTMLALTVPTVAPLMSTFAKGLKDLGTAFRDFMGSMVMESGSGVWNAIKGFFGMKSSGSGFGFFIVTMGILKDTLGSMPEGALDAFTAFLRTISSFVFNSSPFAAMVQSIKEMISLLNSLPEEKLLNITSNMQSLGDVGEQVNSFKGVLEAVGSISSEKVSLVRDVVNTAKDYYSSTNEFAQTQSAAPQKQEEVELTVELDGQEIGNILIPLIQGKLAAKYFQDTLYE